MELGRPQHKTCATMQDVSRAQTLSCYHYGMPIAQTWDPATYARNARFVSDLGSPVVELLAPKPGERILDLGCGDGVLTKKLADLGCEVVAVD